MKNTLLYFILLASFSLIFFSCKKEPRNIAERPTIIQGEEELFHQVNPVNINSKGFEFLNKMPGHWVGANRVIADDYDWFTFDYRPISSSHLHGIFEGGAMGNLFTSFFVTDYKGTRTLMARNGGLLNGIYRTSYFVLDSVNYNSSDTTYRFVDAIGGAGTMFMELKFQQDSLFFNAYTSRLGIILPPTRHMTFKAVRTQPALASTAASDLSYPQNVIEWDFSAGFNASDLYLEPGEDSAHSASFLWQGPFDVYTLATLANDPFKIQDHSYIANLTVDIDRNASIAGKRCFIYLSTQPLTTAGGFLGVTGWNSITLFPDVDGSTDSFTFTYLHPGTYYVSVIADNGDFYPGAGDYTHPPQQITINPDGTHSITITNITTIN